MMRSSLFMLCAYFFLFSANNNVSIRVCASDNTESGEVTKAKPHLIKEDEHEIGYWMTLVTKAGPPLLSSQSKYQKIELFESEHFGKILVLDDCVQLTERDADSYNEMMAHVPMMEHPQPKRVLVIGGGDGYVVSEVLKHKSVSLVDHVELDEAVINTSKQHFSWAKKAWDDPRVKLHLVDGAAFVRNAQSGFYDVIIQDSSDPFVMEEDGTRISLPSEVLYQPEHFDHIARALTTNGVFTFQSETYNIPSSLEGIREWRTSAIRAGFESARYGTISISSYPTGQIGFFVCRKSGREDSNLSDNEFKVISDRFQLFDRLVSYYHPRMQRSCFDLPLWVERYIYDDENIDSQVCDRSSNSMKCSDDNIVVP